MKNAVALGQIKENEAQIQKRIISALSTSIYKFLVSKSDNIKNIVRDIIYDNITNSITWRELIDGNLRIDLGLTNPAVRLLNILSVLLDSIEVKVRKVSFKGEDFVGRLRIQAVRSDYSEILDSSDAIVVTSEGEELEWLRWLLTKGTKPIVSGYDVYYKTGYGRTGGGIMKEGGDWGIGPAHAGVRGDNFITRALDASEDRLRREVLNVLLS